MYRERVSCIVRRRPASLPGIVLLVTEGRLADGGHLRRPLRTLRLDELAPLRPHLRNRELPKKKRNVSHNPDYKIYKILFSIKERKRNPMNPFRPGANTWTLTFYTFPSPKWYTLLIYAWSSTERAKSPITTSVICIGGKINWGF